MANRRHQIFLHCLQQLILFRSDFNLIDNADKNWFAQRLSWHKLLPMAAAIHNDYANKSCVLQDVFSHAYLRNVAAEENYYHQCQSLWDLLTQHNIDFIPYKGPFFSNHIYPAYHYRHIGDIDLIMSPQDSQHLSQLLQQQGYRAEILGDNEQDDFIHRGELTLHAPTDKPHFTSVQIHWHLMPAPRFLKCRYIQNEDFFTHAHSEIWRGLPYLLPPAHARFLYLALHATCQHQFNRLILLIEMAMLLEHAEALSWSKLFSLAKARNAQKPLYFALLFLNEIYPLPISAKQYLKNTNINMFSYLLAAPMSLSSIIDADKQTGRNIRKLFRTAMS